MPGLDRRLVHRIPAGQPDLLPRPGQGRQDPFALLSALHRMGGDGKRVLFLSFEIAAGKDPKEPGIADRLDCFGAGIDLIRYMQGELTNEEKQKLTEFRADLRPRRPLS